MKKAKVIIAVSVCTTLVTVTAAVLFLKNEGAAENEQEQDALVDETAPLPQIATEILAKEFAGQIETRNVNPAELAEPEPSAIPEAIELGSRDYEEPAQEAPQPEKKESKKDHHQKPGRGIASVEKSLSLTVDKAGTKVSKNLDKKKVLELLAKKLDKNCQPNLADKTKTLKAQISLSKTGSIANIKVTPSSAEKGLAKCMRKKLADAKALKPKNKSVAQVTVQFKVK